jgi:hypothetical protein
MADNNITLAQVQGLIKGVVFPTVKPNLIDYAQNHGAPQYIISVLEKLPDKEYQGQSDIIDEVIKKII